MAKNENKEIDLENPYSNESLNKTIQNYNYNYNELWTIQNPAIFSNNDVNNSNNKCKAFEEAGVEKELFFGKQPIQGSVQKDTIINDKKEIKQSILIINHIMSINIESKVKKQKNKYYNINNNNNINNIKIPKNENQSLNSNHRIQNQVQNSILENRPNPFYVKVNQSFQILGKNPNKEKKEEKSKENKIKEELNPQVKIIKKRPRIKPQKLIGNISYFNSVVQLICNLKFFVIYFSEYQNKNDFKRNNCLLSFAIYQICSNLCNFNNQNEREKYNYELLELLGNYNITYKDNQEKNPNDLIILLLDKLHEELTNSINQNNNNSFISDYFSWIELKQITCNCCQNMNLIYRNFNAFELNLIETAQWKNNPNINIKDCLEFYEINKEKTNFCNRCNNYTKSFNFTKIFSSPKYFIFLIDIGQNSNIYLMLEQEINLEKFIIKKEEKAQNFELNGIVFYHTIKNKYNVLYISHQNQNWYLFDDEKVELSNINDFINTYNYSNSIYKLSILVYSLKDLY